MAVTYLIQAGGDWFSTDWQSRTYVDSPQAAADGIAMFGWRANPDGTPFGLPVSLNAVWNSLPLNDARR